MTSPQATGSCDKDLVALGPAFSGDRFPRPAAAPSLASLTTCVFPSSSSTSTYFLATKSQPGAEPIARGQMGSAAHHQVLRGAPRRVIRCACLAAEDREDTLEQAGESTPGSSFP